MEKTKSETLFLSGKTDEAYPLFEAEAKEGRGRAMYFLGCYLQDGIGHIAVDEEAAISWFQKGKEAGDPLCALALLDYADEKDMWDIVNNDFAKALKMAVAGDIIAMDEAGRFYLGAGIILNFEEGLKWLTKASMFDYWRALYHLGKAYQEGYAANRDEERAFLCFQKAARFHDHASEMELGACYEEGKGTEKDEGKAMEWYRKAWDDGASEAGAALGELYAGEGKSKKYAEKSFSWFSKGAKKGNGKALAALARFYDEGITVKKDSAMAEKLYRKAAEKGEDESWFSLALLYLEKGKKEEGFAAMKKAAEAGIGKAQYALGMMYLQGDGVEEDDDEGIRWMEEASENGITEAQKVISLYI